ncbi:MAG: DUF1570 domain-containing protein [Phycisphaerae bacterium]
MAEQWRATVQKHGCLIAIAACLLAAGCSRGLEGVGAGVSSDEDAARCISLVSGAGRNFQAHETSHFMVVSAVDSATAAAAGKFLDQVADRFYCSFSRAGFSLKPPPDKLICVMLDSYADLDAYGRTADGVEASWMDGYYSYHTNRIAVVQFEAAARPAVSRVRTSGDRAAYAYSSASPAADDGPKLTTITHELAHQLAFNSGLQRRDTVYPFWLTEGLAANFEADGTGSYGLGQQVSRYRGRLGQAKAGGRLIPMERFLDMTDAPSGSQQAIRDAYAQAWGLFNYLLARRRGDLRNYMAGLGPRSALGGPSLKREFAAAFGPIDALEKDYLSFINGLAAREAR